MSNLLIYGATGYTGKIMAAMAVERGMTPTLSGRNEEKLKNIAEPLNLPYKAVELTDKSSLEDLLRPMDAVIHCAGPFSATSAPMAAACLKTGTHYLDITGEIEVFENLHKLDDLAKQAGIMLMPGVGFDVVPTDCMAAHMKNRLPGAQNLSLSIGGMKGVSPGTAKTAVESIGKKTLVRRNGQIIPSNTITGTADFGKGERKTIAASWGDVSTAYHTTGIPNITVYFQANKQLEKAANMGPLGRWVMSTSFMQKKLKKMIDQKVSGPSDDQRKQSWGMIVAEASVDENRKLFSQLRVPEGYTLTCMTALEIASQVLEGKWQTGFHTPAGIFGADFILQFEGVERKDMS